MKKLFALLLACITALTVVGCSTDSGESSRVYADIPEISQSSSYESNVSSESELSEPSSESELSEVSSEAAETKAPSSAASKPASSVSSASKAEAPAKENQSRVSSSKAPVVSSKPQAAAPSKQETVSKKPAADSKVPLQGEPQGQNVWIASSGRGTKYHSDPDCSNMKDPIKISLSKAKAQGYTACKKCY